MVVLEPNGNPPEMEIADVLALDSRPEVVVVTDTHSPELETRLLATGASAVLSAGLDDHQLLSSILRVARTRGDRESRSGDPTATLGDRSNSERVRGLLELASVVATGDSSVLILGETGSGKEWLARRIHAQSPRAKGPFVAVNCAAIPEGLAESELFGHVRGAFTGALRTRRGHFEMADGGTLFLDEIGELTPSVQVRLLRALQERTFQPVGGERPIPVDLRVMAATNKPLNEAVAQGGFRKDLYYRIAVITLQVPPLRDRPEDIVPLAEAYARHFALQFGKPVPTFGAATLEALVAYAWPGNIRELINFVERAVLLGQAAEPTIQPSAGQVTSGVPGEAVVRPAPTIEPSLDLPYAEALDHFERSYFSRLLASTEGRVGEAAQRARMSRRNLYNKLRRHGIDREDFVV